jgi:hypothetical protein
MTTRKDVEELMAHIRRNNTYIRDDVMASDVLRSLIDENAELNRTVWHWNQALSATDNFKTTKGEV